VLVFDDVDELSRRAKRVVHLGVVGFVDGTL